MKTEKIFSKDKVYLLEIEYKTKIKNATCYIKKDKIKINIPKYLSFKEKDKLYTKLKHWAINRLKNKDLIINSINNKFKVYFSGYLIKTINKDYILEINYKNKKNNSAKLEKNKINLYLSNSLIKESQEKNKIINNLIGLIVGQDNLDYIKQRIDFFNKNHFKKDIQKISIKNTYSQWGSCTKDMKLSFSSRIFLFEKEVIDYLIVHEMTHLIYMNHSRNFWKKIESIIPDYKTYKKKLREKSYISF